MKNFTIVFLLIFVAVLENGESVADLEYCEDRSWYKFQNNCYSVDYSSSNKRLSYYDAEDYCRAKGAHLVSIHSKAEDDFLLKLLSRSYYRARHWIGLNILKGNSVYEWSDGSNVDYKNIVSKTQYLKEKCFIYLTGKGGWSPEHCALHYTPICKKSISDVAPSPLPSTTAHPEGNCPQEWLQFGQKCYKYFGAKEEERKQFKEAKMACISLGEDHDLASIHSMEEQAFLTQHLYYLGTSAWIGLHKIPSDEIGHDIVFGWSDNSRTDFTYWAPGHPLRGTWKDCACLSFEGVNKGEWIGDYCGIDKKGYICSRPPVSGLQPQKLLPSKCGSKAAEYRDSCYQYFSDKKTRNEAEESCKKIDGHLVSVTDSFEQAFLYNFIGHRTDSIWTGLKNIQNTNAFGWPDKQLLFYTNFNNDEYSRASGAPACVSMTPVDSLKWNVSSCNLNLPYVCKVFNGPHPPIPAPVIGKCPSQGISWIDIGDRYCYHLGQSKYDVLQWGTNSRYCTSKGMEMITLTNEHQLNSLMAYLWNSTYNYWLGLIKSFDTNDFIWLDGTPVNYTNWAKIRGLFSSDGCATVSPRDLKWYTSACNNWNRNICRAKKIMD